LFNEHMRQFPYKILADQHVTYVRARLYRDLQQIQTVGDEKAPLATVLLLLQLVGELDAVVLPSRDFANHGRNPRRSARLRARWLGRDVIPSRA
jgi:hypothetical protein